MEAFDYVLLAAALSAVLSAFGGVLCIVVGLAFLFVLRVPSALALMALGAALLCYGAVAVENWQKALGFWAAMEAFRFLFFVTTEGKGRFR